MTQIRDSYPRWSRSVEQQVALYEQYAATVEARLEQLVRESDRGVAPLVAPLPAVEHEEQLSGGTVICVVCRRDHQTGP
ncbi:MAG TPA: hypothetical protein VI111_04600, partial [Thermoleophilaceae bacterium]